MQLVSKQWFGKHVSGQQTPTQQQKNGVFYVVPSEVLWAGQFEAMKHLFVGVVSSSAEWSDMK
jgi:hypothetical protein